MVSVEHILEDICHFFTDLFLKIQQEITICIDNNETDEEALDSAFNLKNLYDVYYQLLLDKDKLHNFTVGPFKFPDSFDLYSDKLSANFTISIYSIKVNGSPKLQIVVYKENKIIKNDIIDRIDNYYNYGAILNHILLLGILVEKL